MRSQFAILLIFSLAAVVSSATSPSPNPRVPSSFSCNATWASSLSTELTNSINAALAANASKTITHGGSKPYWQFSVPSFCFNNVFGFGQSGCAGGKTYSASTSDTTTVQGILNAKIVVNLQQTSCSLTNAAGTWTATATWPKITSTSQVAVYPVTGGYLGLELQMTISNMVANLAGTYGYNVSSGELCLTDLTATSSSMNPGSVYVGAGVASSSGTSLTELPSMENKISSQIKSKGSSVYKQVNKKTAPKVGTCKASNSPPSPRPPRSPVTRSPPSPRSPVSAPPVPGLSPGRK